MTTAVSTEARQLCTVDAGGHRFGIDVLKVQEVLKPRPTTHVPLAPDSLHGLINLRGQVVTVIDLRHRLGFAPRLAEAPHMLVILRDGDVLVGLVVDGVGDVVEPPADSYERAPDTLPLRLRSFVPGVHKLDDQLLLLLEPESVLNLSKSGSP